MGRTAGATSETTKFIRDALAAARDVTAEAVRFAEDTNLIERVRDHLLDELDERRERLGAYASGQSAQAPARRPSIRQFAMRLYSCRTRGEIRALIDQDPTLLQDWDDIKIAYVDDLDDEFVESIEDSLDPAKKTRLNRKRLEEACRQAVYPHRLGR